MLRVIPLLLFTAIALCYYAGVVKLAARILHFCVTWKSSFLFALLMFIAVVYTRGISPAANLAIVICQMFVMAIVLSALGSWFFKNRIRDTDGRILGWPGSARLSALALSFIFALGVATLIVVRAFSSHSNVQP